MTMPPRTRNTRASSASFCTSIPWNPPLGAGAFFIAIPFAIKCSLAREGPEQNTGDRMPRWLSPRWLGLSSSEPRCKTCTRSAESAEVHAHLVPRESLLARMAKNVLLHLKEGASRQTILLVLLIAVSAFFPVQTDPP